MPIYEYKCDACGHQFERLAKNSTDHPDECPACNATAPTKQFSSFAPAMGSSTSDTACPAAPGCPAGGCCSDGNCAL